MRTSARYMVVVVMLSSASCARRAEKPPEEAPVRVESKGQSLFTLRVEPTTVALKAGDEAKLKVSVQRGTFQDAITLEVKDLPAGVTASSALIPPGREDIEVTVKAAAGAVPAEKGTVRVWGNQAEATPHFTVKVVEGTFTLHPAAGKNVITPGGKATLVVRADRLGFNGPITVGLLNLPKGVQATKATTKGKNLAVIELTAAPETALGDKQIQAEGAGGSQKVASAPFPLSVIPPPFDIKVEPDTVTINHGSSAKVKVTATRRDYHGPIDVTLVNVPGYVKGATVIPKGANSAEMTINVPVGVESSKSPGAQVSGYVKEDKSTRMSSHFTVNVEGRPFDIAFGGGGGKGGGKGSTGPIIIPVLQGGSAKLNVNASRKGFDAPIQLNLQNLPKHVTGSSPIIGRGETGAEITITASADAPVQDYPGVQVAAVPVENQKERVTLGGITIRVLGPFALEVDPKTLRLTQGGKALVKVTAVRRKYDGPIEVEWRDLPKPLVGTKATIPEGKTEIDIEVAVPENAAVLDKASPRVLGTSKLIPEQALSNPVFMSVSRKLFDLKILPGAINVSTGGKQTVKVVADRKDYRGPIAIEFVNLPAGVKPPKVVTIEAGETEVEVDLSAALNAAEGKRVDVHAVGTATTVATKPQSASPNVTFSVEPGLFDLTLEPAAVRLAHGATAKIKVAIARKGYNGAIVLEAKKLPAGVSAAKINVAAGESKAEIELKADFMAALGDKVEPYLLAYTATGKQVVSPHFTVGVSSSAGAPTLLLKVEPAAVVVAPGGTAKVKVTAIRKGYTGALTVELHNLPAGLNAAPVIMDKEQSQVELPLTAQPGAKATSVSDVCAVGFAIQMDGLAHASPHFSVRVGKK